MKEKNIRPPADTQAFYVFEKKKVQKKKISGHQLVDNILRIERQNSQIHNLDPSSF
jgi:hypothetical protein